MYDPLRHDPRDFATMARTPVTIGLCVLALAATVARWWGREELVEPLYLTPRAFVDQPWRLVTCTLPHATMPLHLLFNAYWTWRLGTIVEISFGSWRTLALFLVTALGSNALQWAFSGGAIGLSGYVYGLFAFLWVLSKRDARCRHFMVPATAQIFVVWFFLCIVLSNTGALNIANFAHGGGAAFGALIGWTFTAPAPLRLAGLGTLALAGVVLALLATALRPHVHRDVEREAALLVQEGYEAILRDDMQAAVRWNRLATRYDQSNWRAWNNLSIAYSELGRHAEAADARARRIALRPLGEEEL